MASRASWMSILLLVGTAGCSDLEGYRGDYAGDVVGAVECQDDVDAPCSFVRRGFPGGTELTIDSFDPTIQRFDEASGTSPGLLTTDDAAGCAAIGPTLQDEPLRPIPALAHDALSQYELPGSGRLRSYVYALEPSRGPLAGRDAMVFVSLMEEGKVEVRIVAGDGSEEDCAALADPCVRRAAGTCDYFGVFELRATP